jgi:hypothetical protein
MHRTCKLIDIQISCYFLDLQNASQRRELDALDKALARAKAANFDNQLDLQIVVAQRLRDQLARIEKLRHSVLNMDQKTIAEIRTYSNPPDGVHQSLMRNHCSYKCIECYTKPQIKCVLHTIMVYITLTTYTYPYKECRGSSTDVSYMFKRVF